VYTNWIAGRDFCQAVSAARANPRREPLASGRYPCPFPYVSRRQHYAIVSTAIQSARSNGDYAVHLAQQSIRCNVDVSSYMLAYFKINHRFRRCIIAIHNVILVQRSSSLAYNTKMYTILLMNNDYPHKTNAHTLTTAAPASDRSSVNRESRGLVWLRPSVPQPAAAHWRTRLRRAHPAQKTWPRWLIRHAASQHYFIRPHRTHSVWCIKTCIMS